MAQYIVHGGNPLRGTVRPLGNKNAVLPMIAATLLTDEPVTLKNVPNIIDVRTMLELLQGLGAQVDFDPAQHTLQICCDGVSQYKILDEKVTDVRASILFVGALLARLGRVEILPPGGCQIGLRQVDTHFVNFSRLGVSVQYGSPIRAHCSKLRGAFVWSDEMSVTATANFILAAVRADGESVFYNAASEPHIQDLCNLLVKMGAHIEGIGTNKLVIQGVQKLRGAEHVVSEDYAEVGSFLAAAAATNGSVRVQDVKAHLYRQIIYQYSKLGVKVKSLTDALEVKADQERTIQPTMEGHLAKIECLPWPGFPADLLQITLVLATQCSGKILIHDKMFESRLFFVDKLIRMGADIFLSDPHRAIVFGPKELKGKFIESPDLRAGMALVIAALAADGMSVIDNVQFIERGYEQLDQRLRDLGADIVRRPLD